MTMVSKYPLDKEVQKRVYEIFLETLADLKNKEEVKDFLEEFLSPTEKIMLAKRLSVAVLLAKGYDYRSIGKILKVSTTTIHDINLWIRHNPGFLLKVVKNILQKEKRGEFWSNLGYNIEKAAIPLTTGNWSEKRRDIERERIKKIKPF